MTNRIIQVIGQGFNPTPVSIVATVDGNVVYSGTVPTVDQGIYVTQLPEHSELQGQLTSTKTALFSFEKDLNYQGNVSITISVTGGSVWFGTVISNYVSGRYLNPALTPEQQAVVNNSSSTMAELQQIQFDIANPSFTAEQIAQLQTYTSFPYPDEVQAMVVEHNAKLRWHSSGAAFDRLTNIEEGTDVTWSSVSIDGVDHTINPHAYDPPRAGTWWWTVGSGETFEGKIHVPLGVTP